MKYLTKKALEPRSVGTDKILLENDSPFIARNAADDGDINLFKLNTNDTTEILNKTLLNTSLSLQSEVNSQSGVNVSLTLPTKAVVYLTAATSILEIATPTYGQLTVYVNKTGSSIVFKNMDAGAAVGKKINTSTGSNISVPPDSSITLHFDTTDNVHRVINYVAPSGASAEFTKYSVSYTEFTDAALTSTILLTTLPARSVVQACIVKPSTIFAGSGLGICTIEVGIVGDLDRYSWSYDVKQTPSDAVIQSTDCVFDVPAFSTTKLIYVTIRTTGINANALTSGACDIYLKSSQLPA